MADEIVNLFKSITQGIYVVGVCDEDQYNAFTASWIMQVSFNPMMLALSINPDHSSYRLLKGSGVFSVSVLAKDQIELAAHFASRASSKKLSAISWDTHRTRAPILTDALAFFECKLDHETDAGDHKLVLGRVINGELLDPAATPMTYVDTGNMDGASRLFPGSF